MTAYLSEHPLIEAVLDEFPGAEIKGIQMTCRFTKSMQGFLVPADDEANKVVSKARVGETIFLNYPSQRSSKQMRYFHSLCALASDNLDGVTPADIKDAVKLACGHSRTVQIPFNGEVYERKTPRSLEELNGDEFNKFIDLALDYLANELGVDTTVLRTEVAAA